MIHTTHTTQGSGKLWGCQNAPGIILAHGHANLECLLVVGAPLVADGVLLYQRPEPLRRRRLKIAIIQCNDLAIADINFLRGKYRAHVCRKITYQPIVAGQFDFRARVVNGSG